MNNFQLVDSEKVVKNEIVKILRVNYKNECIAIFDHPCGDTRLAEAIGYISTYGYMAEYRRRWNNGDRCNWDSSLIATI